MEKNNNISKMCSFVRRLFNLVTSVLTGEVHHFRWDVQDQQERIC